MTKKQFETYFKNEVLPTLAHQDKTARRTAWNDTVDAMIKGGELPERAGDWSHPAWLVGKRSNPRKRKKNLSTGAWVAISVGIGIGVPVVVIGGVLLYGMKKGSEIANKTIDEFPDANRPMPPIPTPMP